MQLIILFCLKYLRVQPPRHWKNSSSLSETLQALRARRVVWRRRVWLGLLCLPMWGLALPAAQADAAAIKSKTLDNGLKVFVKVDRRAPVAVSMLWYRAGSMDETNGTTGVAHVLEHMMFQGTRDLGPGEFAKKIAKVGGRTNAFTSSDYTGYYEQLHKSHLELAMRLESDRMANLKLDENEFQRELRVVMEERRQRIDDNPRALAFERLNAAMYIEHPYHHPVAGWMSDLKSMELSDARTWYDSWYVPNNAALVVAGDVDPENVFDLAGKYFGPIKARTLPVRKPQTEPEQRGIRRIVVKGQVHIPEVTMAYHVPALKDVENDQDAYALSILAGVLDGYSAARLEREMVKRSRVANSVSSDYDGLRRGPGAFYVSFTPGQGKTVENVEKAWRDQLALLIKDGVTEQELRTVKAQVIAEQVYSEDSIYDQASRIGRMVSLGLPADAATTITQKLRQVSAEQVIEVARKYLIDDRLTVAVLEPEAAPDQAKPDNSDEAAVK